MWVRGKKIRQDGKSSFFIARFVEGRMVSRQHREPMLLSYLLPLSRHASSQANRPEGISVFPVSPYHTARASVFYLLHVNLKNKKKVLGFRSRCGFFRKRWKSALKITGRATVSDTSWVCSSVGGIWYVPPGLEWPQWFIVARAEGSTSSWFLRF